MQKVKTFTRVAFLGSKDLHQKCVIHNKFNAKWVICDKFNTILKKTSFMPKNANKLQIMSCKLGWQMGPNLKWSAKDCMAFTVILYSIVLYYKSHLGEAWWQEYMIRPKLFKENKNKRARVVIPTEASVKLAHGNIPKPWWCETLKEIITFIGPTFFSCVPHKSLYI